MKIHPLNRHLIECLRDMKEIGVSKEFAREILREEMVAYIDVVPVYVEDLLRRKIPLNLRSRKLRDIAIANRQYKKTGVEEIKMKGLNLEEIFDIDYSNNSSMFENNSYQ